MNKLRVKVNSGKLAALTDRTEYYDKDKSEYKKTYEFTTLC